MQKETSVKDEHSQTYPTGLYIIATPIGNLRDITLRALDVLALVDVVLCEDTRVSGKLMSHYGLNKKLLSYHDHNGEERRPQIMQMLEQGQRIALVSDAGTPLISDPGYKLVRDVQAEGHYVSVLPGASSVLSALCLAGLPTNQFYFAGFLPPKQGAAADQLHALKSVEATLVFFESARRLIDTLEQMQSILGKREVAVVREITKLFEESRRGDFDTLLAHYRDKGEPKGEVVIVVSPPQANAQAQDATAMLQALLTSHSIKEASAIVAEQTGRPRKEIYALALQLK